MRALLLAAGLGTRLRPVTDTIPKCLVKIGEHSLIDYWFQLLFDSGVERVLMNTHYLAGAVQDHVANSPWRSKIELVHEEKLLGTGGTVLANASFFRNRPFLVAHADNLTSFDLEEFQRQHENRPIGDETVGTMMTFDTDNPQSCGIVECDSNGLLRGFHEKVANPPGACANAAVYIFEPIFIDRLRLVQSAEIDISTEVIPDLMGRIYTYHNPKYLRDIGTLSSLERANLDVDRDSDLQMLHKKISLNRAAS